MQLALSVASPFVNVLVSLKCSVICVVFFYVEAHLITVHILSPSPVK